MVKNSLTAPLNLSGRLHDQSAGGSSDRGFVMTHIRATIFRAAAAAAMAYASLGTSSALADPLSFAAPNARPGFLFDTVIRDQTMRDRGAAEEADSTAEVPARLRRQVVDYPTREAPGTIIIDTPNTYLYYVMGGGKAMRYGIGVGREGFTWSGVKAIERK